MSELRVKYPPNALTVAQVDQQSPAERAGIRAGDLLQQINGYPILDILDYQYHSAEQRLRIELLRDGAPVQLTIIRNEEELPGITFLHDLGDKIHTCNNKCVFCFIHQMPKKMRKTLYLMDDDFRLSFMHGNYVTLTNVSDAEFNRIIKQRLSPLYVSVHATDPVLRAMLLGKAEAQPIMPKLRALADARIDTHTQIVLCPGLNDGDALNRTIGELAAEHSAQSGKRSGVLSVAIVPVGLTRFRERLPNLETADRDYARSMIARVAALERSLLAQLGTRFCWLSDEWYFLADVPVPSARHYEEFPQLEDGVGTVRMFLEQQRSLVRRLPSVAPAPVSATVVTAELPGPIIQQLANRLNQIGKVNVNVCVVRNEFFGGGISIAGLLTAVDIRSHLERFNKHATIYIPAICLRDGELFLDDITVTELRAETGWDLRVVQPDPRSLAAAMGLVPERRGRHMPATGWVMEERITLPAQTAALST